MYGSNNYDYMYICSLNVIHTFLLPSAESAWSSDWPLIFCSCAYAAEPTSTTESICEWHSLWDTQLKDGLHVHVHCTCISMINYELQVHVYYMHTIFVYWLLWLLSWQQKLLNFFSTLLLSSSPLPFFPPPCMFAKTSTFSHTILLRTPSLSHTPAPQISHWSDTPAAPQPGQAHMPGMPPLLSLHVATDHKPSAAQKTGEDPGPTEIILLSRSALWLVESDAVIWIQPHSHVVNVYMV